MPNALYRFVRGLKELTEHLSALKQLCCPKCGAVETLNRHSKLYGNDPDDPAGRLQRGQRVWCCPRGRRGGCGRAFSVFIADMLPRHTFTATWLWQWLVELLAGLSLKAAAQTLRPPFALETVYRLRRSLRCQLDALRAQLCRRQSPPASPHTDPLLQTAQHLQTVFAGSACPAAEFQLQFQRPFLG